MVRSPSRSPASYAANPGASPGRIHIPRLVDDPIASLAAWSIDISVRGQHGTIPPLSAASWLAVLMTEDVDLWDVVPGLCPELNGPLTKMLLNEDVDPDDIRKVALDVIETASGRRWWVAVRLVSIVRQSWEVVGGEMTLQGIRPAEIPFGAWLDAALLICVKGLEADKVTMFTSQLEAPPPDSGIKVQEMTMSPSEFMALGAM